MAKEWKNRGLKSTTRVALIFVLSVLCFQIVFSAVYLVRSRQNSEMLQQSAISLFAESTEGYYQRASNAVSKLLRDSNALELSYRREITQTNYQKVYSLVRTLRASTTPGDPLIRDVFVYFFQSDMLYNQDGLCQRTEPGKSRYVALRWKTLFGQEEGDFFLHDEPVETGGEAYRANLVGYANERMVVAVSCPLDAVTEMADNALANVNAQAVYQTDGGDILSASSKVAGLTAIDVQAASYGKLDALRAYRFDTAPRPGGFVLVGFLRNQPTEIIRRGGLMIALVNALCLVGIALYLAVFRRRLFRPLDRLLSRAAGMDATGRESEFDRLDRYIDGLQQATAAADTRYLSAHSRNQLIDLARGLPGEAGAPQPPQPGEEYAVLSVVCEQESGVEDRALAAQTEQALAGFDPWPICRQGRQTLYCVPLPDGPAPLLETLNAIAKPGVLFALSAVRDDLRSLHAAMDEAAGAMKLAGQASAEDAVRRYESGYAVDPFGGVSSVVESALKHGVESGDLRLCREQLDRLHALYATASVFQQRGLCLHLLNLLARFSRQTGRSVPDACLQRVAAAYGFDAMWQQVLAQYEQFIPEDPREDELQDRIKAFISEHYMDPEMSLQMVADHVGMSYSYLSRFIKQFSGVGFADYVTQLRIDHAKQLLAQTDLPVGEVLSSVGFTVFSSFSRAFKKYAGVSPSEFRAARRNQAAGDTAPETQP